MDKRCRPSYCICGYVLPQRVVVCLLCAFAMIVCCGQRDEETMGIAVYTTRVIASENKTTYRSQFFGKRNMSDLDIEEMNIDLSEVTLNLLLTAFPIGHFIGQVPAGIIADELGTKWLFLIGMAISTLVSLVLPIMIIKCDLLLVNFVRVFSGMTQSVMYPCTSVLLAHWVPFPERARLGGFTFAVYPLAEMISDAVGEVARMGNPHNWKFVFYFWAVMGCIWCVMYGFLVYDSPIVHPRITASEKEYLDNTLPTFGRINITFKNLFRHHGIWALIIGQIGHNFTIRLMVVDVPWNLYQVLGVPKSRVGVTSLVPFVGFVATSVISGVIIDYGVTKKHWDLKWTRRIATYISFVFPNTFLCIAFYVRNNQFMLTTCYTIAVLLSGSYSASFRVNHLDITVNAAGVSLAMINFFGDVVAFVIFVIVRLILQESYLRSWEINTWLALALASVCTTHYLFTAQVERAHWDLAQPPKPAT
ncbi:hypothetical protein Trydic_g3317 [Trypoxylus dichotomus]